MTTNIISFRKEYLINFLNYQFKNNTSLKKYYLEWLKINVISFIIPKVEKHLTTCQIKLELSDEYPFDKKQYLSIAKMKKFEIIVFNSFNVIMFNNLFINENRLKVGQEIEKMLYKYNIDYKYSTALLKRYYRIRKSNDIST